jgi:hypothetical protein
MDTNLIYRLAMTASSANSQIICVGQLSMLFSYNSLVGVSFEREMLQADVRTPTTARHINNAGFAFARRATHAELQALALVGMSREVSRQAASKLAA